MCQFVLKLFVAGQTARSHIAIATLQDLCQGALRDRVDLIIVDILEYPHLAEQEHILGTPTLIREFPLPRRYIIGDLSDGERVMAVLGAAHDGQHNGEDG